MHPLATCYIVTMTFEAWPWFATVHSVTMGSPLVKCHNFWCKATLKYAPDTGVKSSRKCASSRYYPSPTVLRGDDSSCNSVRKYADKTGMTSCLKPVLGGLNKLCCELRWRGGFVPKFNDMHNVREYWDCVYDGLMVYWGIMYTLCCTVVNIVLYFQHFSFYLRLLCIYTWKEWSRRTNFKKSNKFPVL